MSGEYNIEDFVEQIDEEGGVDSAMRYQISLSDYELPKDVKDAWLNARSAWEDFDSATADFWAVVKQHGIDY